MFVLATLCKTHRFDTFTSNRLFSVHFYFLHFTSAQSLTNSTIKNWFHVHQPFVVKMGNSLLFLATRFPSLRLTPVQCFSGCRISTLFPATHFNRSHSTIKSVLSLKS